MDINIKKKKIRQEMILMRSAIPPGQKSKWDKKVNKSLIKLANNADYIHTYLPMGDEMDIYPFIKDCLAKGKVVICPQALPKGILKNLVLNALDELEDGVFGTQYPSGHHLFRGNYDLIIVPGLAFDQEGFRVGYGGGYYDRFLSRQSKALKVAACYSFQLLEDIPKESFDVPVDELVVIDF